MTRRLILSVPVVASLLLASCDEGSEGPMPRDNRVLLPPEDDEHHVFLAEEVVIEPGEEKMYCFHMVAEEEMALTDIEMLQGEYGHHAVIVSSSDPLPPGTIEDCTEEESSSKFTAFLIPVADPPEGAAMHIKPGTPVVLQSHYVNASDEPILRWGSNPRRRKRSRDLVRLRDGSRRRSALHRRPHARAGLELRGPPAAGRIVPEPR